MWDELAGMLFRDGEDVLFQYDNEYITNGGMPVSLSLPFQNEPYIEPVYFRILLDGDEMNFQSKVTGYSPNDYLSILSVTDIDFPGAIKINRIEPNI